MIITNIINKPSLINTASMTDPTPIIPLSEPPWLTGAPSPYYDESHRRVQAACREFIHENLGRHALEWETAEDVPLHVYGTFAKAGFLLPSLPCPLPVEWLKKVGVTHMPGNVPVEEWTSLHGMIYGDEMSRAGLAGPAGALTTGMAFGVPPLLHYADRQLQERYLPDLLTGKTRTCIAITEPEAGSDVANILTTAEVSKCGKFYIVNGSKKWITNGIWADCATMAVRTGPEGSGARGISMLVVPLANTKGVMRRRIKVSGQISAGTTYIELDDVKVPRENLIGKEGEGMKYIMNNFNHERLFISIGTTRQARVALSAAFEYCMKREAFGKVCSSTRVREWDLALTLLDFDRTTRRPSPPRQMRRYPRSSTSLGRVLRLPDDTITQSKGRQRSGWVDCPVQGQRWYRA